MEGEKGLGAKGHEGGGKKLKAWGWRELVTMRCILHNGCRSTYNFKPPFKVYTSVEEDPNTAFKVSSHNSTSGQRNGLALLCVAPNARIQLHISSAAGTAMSF